MPPRGRCSPQSPRHKAHAGGDGTGAMTWARSDASATADIEYVLTPSLPRRESLSRSLLALLRRGGSADDEKGKMRPNLA
jgi:hypothetical protein